MARRRERERLQNSGMGLFWPSKHDQTNFDAEDSDESEFISDDEDLERPGVLQSLQGGVLPADLLALHAVCLLGAGGRDFAALRYAERVLAAGGLARGGDDWGGPDAVAAADPRLRAFAEDLLSPVDDAFLLSSVAGLVSGGARIHPQSHAMLSILRRHFLTKLVDPNRGLDFDEVLSSAPKKVRALATLTMTLKLLIDCARTDLALMDAPGKGKTKTVEQAANDSIYALQIMIRFQYILWNPSDSEWGLPQPSIDMVFVLSGAISILVQSASSVEDQSVHDLVQVGLTKSRKLISTICQADDDASQPAKSSSAETWQSFPLPALWQNSFHKKISLRAYNLCVASCVSSFCGWESTEFTLDQLSYSDVNFFGVTFDGPSAAGFLPDSASAAVAEQWGYLLSKILPDLEELQFEAHLEDRKSQDWHKQAMSNMRKQSVDSSKIVRYGEEDGIRALLSFSTLCLFAAEDCVGEEKDEFVKLSMSVLLPMTQFSIDKQVWQSNLGTMVMSGKAQLSYYLDENCHWLGPTKTKAGHKKMANTDFKRPWRAPKLTRPVRALRSTNTVSVPTSVLSEEWKKDDAFFEKKFAFENAQKAMKTLDDAMKNLRKSRTLSSLEQASIDASVALVCLVNFEECNNPFVCMQQAAMFAEMGSKRGNSDEPFKRFLPLKTSCSPANALNILCRADCLRAVHFLHEAQYLCTWVASVCQAHRDVTEQELPWNSRWLVVGVLTYMISAAIDDTADIVSVDNTDARILSKWEEVAKEEISRGKSDALLIVNGPSGNNNFVRMNSSHGSNVVPCTEGSLRVETKDSCASHCEAKASLPSSEAGVPFDSSQHDVTDYGASHGAKTPLLSSEAEAPSVSNQKYIAGEVFGGSCDDLPLPSINNPTVDGLPPDLNVDEYLYEGLNNHVPEITTMEDGDADSPFDGFEVGGI